MRGLILAALLAFCTSASAQTTTTVYPDGRIVTTTYPAQPPRVVYTMPATIPMTTYYAAPVYAVPTYAVPVYMPRTVEVRQGFFGRTRVIYR